MEHYTTRLYRGAVYSIYIVTLVTDIFNDVKWSLASLFLFDSSSEGL